MNQNVCLAESEDESMALNDVTRFSQSRNKELEEIHGDGFLHGLTQRMSHFVWAQGSAGCWRPYECQKQGNLQQSSWVSTIKIH